MDLPPVEYMNIYFSLNFPLLGKEGGKLVTYSPSRPYGGGLGLP